VGVADDHQHRAQRGAARSRREVGLPVSVHRPGERHAGNLEGIDKGFNKAPRFEDDLAKIRARASSDRAHDVGLDGDDTTSFQKTLDSWSRTSSRS